MAKESVVSVLEVLYKGNISEALSNLSAMCMLVFSLLYTPCVASVISVKRELGNKYAVFVVAWQCMVAWFVALIVHLIGMMVMSF